jgi:hypothetical protein
MKTRFNLNLSLRIANDETGKDKFTKEFIIDELLQGHAKYHTNDRNTTFVVWLKNNNQIMAEVEDIEISLK